MRSTPTGLFTDTLQYNLLLALSETARPHDGITEEYQDIIQASQECSEELALLESGVLQRQNNVYITENKQIVIPEPLRTSILFDAHHYYDSHLGQRKTDTHLKQKFWWPRMQEQIREYVAGCAECARTKQGHEKRNEDQIAVALPLPSIKSSVTGSISAMPFLRVYYT